MKKSLYLLISLTIVLSISFCTYVKPLALSYDFGTEELTHVNTPASNYFASLRTNFPRNEKGSCAYVAISMLLSYYDSFYSDIFIPEAYDATATFTINENQDKLTIFGSPGVRKEPFSTSLGISYSELLEEYQDTHFQAFLIEYGKSLGINILNEAFDDIIGEGYGAFRYQVVDLLEAYLYDYLGLSENQVQVFRINDDLVFTYDDLREIMIDNIHDGIPMIYFGTPALLESGHYLIPYDYDAEEDLIYFHTGWTKDRLISENYFVDENDFTDFASLIYFVVNEAYLPHSHSNNYINTSTNTAVCSCKFAFHPHHTHTFTGEYLDYNTLTHTAECVYCDGANQSHLLSYTVVSTTHHRASCVCGYSANQLHMAKRGEEYCMACGTRIDDGINHPIIMGNENSILPMNASTQAPTYETYLAANGVIVISEFDYNLLISGQLTIPEIYERVGLVYG